MPTQPRLRSTLTLGAIILLVALTGCADQMADRQLEQVAKGWCKTIRASQVIPIYPLTEDLRPGDVFLVRRSIAEQAKEWEGRGYLVLDDARVRLGYPAPTSPPNTPPPLAEVYQRMYFDGYWSDTFGKNPNPRYAISNPGALAATANGTPADIAKAFFSEAHAPRAAFPSYSFQVRTGTSLGLAVPISGVPVAMSFMQSGNVDGTVTIADAYTYAGDPTLLYQQALAWARSGDQPAILDDAARQNNGPVFLRVITRVYLTGAMAVSITNAEEGGAQAKAGAGPEISILNNTADFAARYKAMLDELDARASASPIKDAAGNLVPGASVKFAWATQRSVALNEKFPTPLVVGYLGLDIPVFAGDSEGDPKFGYPLPTWSLLNQQLKVSERTHFDPVTRDALKSLLDGPNARPLVALEIMRDVSDQVAPMADTPDQTAAWRSIYISADTLLHAPGRDLAASTRALFTRFDIQSSLFTSRPERHATLDHFIDHAYRAHAH